MRQLSRDRLCTRRFLVQPDLKGLAHPSARKEYHFHQAPLIFSEPIVVQCQDHANPSCMLARGQRAIRNRAGDRGVILGSYLRIPKGVGRRKPCAHHGDCRPGALA